MSKSYKHQRMYEERQGEESNDGFDSRRYGNRRKELSRLKVVERARTGSAPTTTWSTTVPVVLPDLTKPLDLAGLDVVERHGNTEAVCPGCKAWVRLGPFYKADRKVMLAVPHKYPCEHFETILKSGALRQCTTE
jgi:hypothetical protein